MRKILDITAFIGILWYNISERKNDKFNEILVSEGVSNVQERQIPIVWTE